MLTVLCVLPRKLRKNPHGQRLASIHAHLLGAQRARGDHQRQLFDVTTHVAAPRGEIWPQPFALLGGMPRIMEYLALKLPLCRVRLQYVITQLQNAHVLVLAGGEDANCTDVVRKCVNYAAASLTDAPALQAPYPQFTSLRLQHAANAEKHPVEWRPKSKSGRYGVRDAAYLQPLADRLHDATAYEQCVVDEVAGVAGAGVPAALLLLPCPRDCVQGSTPVSGVAPASATASTAAVESAWKRALPKRALPKRALPK